MAEKRVRTSSPFAQCARINALLAHFSRPPRGFTRLGALRARRLRRVRLAFPPLYVSRRLGMTQVLCAMDARKQQRARLARGKGGTGTTFGAREQADTEVAGT